MSTTVRQALVRALNGTPSSVGDNLIDMPMHELIALKLVEIANSGDPEVRGSISKASRAQRMILDRTVGKRMPGTEPTGIVSQGLEFDDLTVGELGDGRL